MVVFHAHFWRSRHDQPGPILALICQPLAAVAYDFPILIEVNLFAEVEDVARTLVYGEEVPGDLVEFAVDFLSLLDDARANAVDFPGLVQHRYHQRAVCGG